VAQRRMYSKSIIESDLFLDMPLSSQALYFHLGMQADDDGFVSPNRIMRMVGAQNDDLKVLMTKQFVIPFENGVVVIRHWKENNYIQKDRKKDTIYLTELAKLSIENNNVYKLDTECTPSIGKVSIGKVSIVEEREKTPSQINKLFFSLFESNKIKEATDLLSTNWTKKLSEIPEGNKSSVLKEFNKFVSYWTEPNKSGTKQLWETKSTFEINRRLNTWFDRALTFNNKINKVGVIKV